MRDMGDALPLSALVDRAARGDERAFDQLVTPTLPRLLRIASAVLGNGGDAYDALQDSLAIAWRELPNLREADRFDAWVARILVNECRRYIRKAVKTRRIEDAYVQSSTVGLNDEPEPRVAALDRLERAFERLDARQRSLLVLHHLEGLPVSVIATAMEIPPGTVKSQLFAARESLKLALEKEEGDGA